MERLMAHNIKKDLIYYGVYNTSEDMWNGSDVLCAARKRFFETGVKQKKRSAVRIDNVSYNYSYSLESGVSLKYRKSKPGQMIEHTVDTPDGYCVEQFNERRQVIKRTYYLRQHLWQRTEYLSEGTVTLRLAPGEDGDMPTLVCKSGKGTAILRPFDVSLDKEMTQKLNVLTHEPRVFCVTNCGSFYFCTEEEQLARKQALDKLLQKEKTAAKTVADKPARTAHTAFVIDFSWLEKRQKPTFDLRDSEEVRLSDEPEQPQTEPNGVSETPEVISVSSGQDTGERKTITEVPAVSVEPPAAEAAPTKPASPTATVTPTAVSGDTVTSTEEAAPFAAAAAVPMTTAVSDTDKPSVSTETSDDTVLAVEEVATMQDESFFAQVAAIAAQTLQAEQGVSSATDVSSAAAAPAAASAPSDTEVSEGALTGTSTEEAAVLMVPAFADAPQSAAAPVQPQCAFAEECPYEAAEKCVITSGDKRYYYFGEKQEDKRHGRGRTVMPNGETVYEGDYVQDKRDGFGVYYYQSGQLCYAGNWKQNRRNGLGAAFSAANGSVLAGRWQEDHAVGVIAHFDQEGHLLYTGGTRNGQRNGAGLTYNPQDGTYFIGKYQDGVFLETGTQLDSSGDLLYTGGYRSNARNGEGTAYRKDGSLQYQGQWLNDRYHGEGTLYRDDGSKVTGHFKNGQVCGQGTLTDANGHTVYSGSFMGDRYNGIGKLFLSDGRYAEGRFIDGEPTGIFNEYNADQKLIYCGEWNGCQRNGRGIAYENGEKRYEGTFRQALYDGEGKLYRDGETVYIGSFKEGKREGFGVAYLHKEMCYKGLWHNDQYNGCGILYENGEARSVGLFKNGQRDGRINEIENRCLRRKSLFVNDKRVYTCEYGMDGSLVYYGSMSGDQRNGMGCSFADHAEKQFEGIFRQNQPDKAMKVFLKDLSELPVCAALSSTEYELYRLTPDYIIEKNITVHGVNTVYSGRLKDGLPDGSGTILYSDHRYTGYFANGLPQGEGVLYLHSGEERRGFFSTKAFEGCKTLVLSDITYFYRAIG